MEDWVNQLLGFVVGGGLIGLLDVFLRWKATKDLAKQSDVTRAFCLIDQLQEDNDRLRKALREIEENNFRRESELTSLRIGVLILIDQLEQMGVIPRWTPDKRIDRIIAEKARE